MAKNHSFGQNLNIWIFAESMAWILDIFKCITCFCFD